MHLLNDDELRQARDASWNPAVRRLLDWYGYAQTLGRGGPVGSSDPQGITVVAPINPAAYVGTAPPAAPPAPAPAPVVLPPLSLGEARKLAAYTQQQVAGLLRVPLERVADLEALDLELLDVDQLVQYAAAIGMALTIQIDLMPGATREIFTTRGKVAELQKALGSPGGQHESQTHGLEGAAPAPAVVDGAEPAPAEDKIPDTMPPGPGEPRPG